MNKLLYSFCSIGLLFLQSLQAQQAPLEQVWDKTFGGISYDEMSAMINTPDGGYLLGGRSGRFGGDDKTDINKGKNDYWLVKIDAQGNKLWDKTFGGQTDENLHTLINTPDGGYLIGGHSDSGISGDKSENSKGGKDYWLVKIDAQGNKLWDKTLGGPGHDYLYAIVNTSDGGYLIGGQSKLSGGDKTEARSGFDYWIVKIDAQGNKLWDKTFGGSAGDFFNTIINTPDGGFLLGGSSNSLATFDKSDGNFGGGDFWIIKIDEEGKKLWDKTLGNDLSESLLDIINTPDGGFLMAGTVNSTEENQTKNGGSDYRIIKTDAQGNRLWDKMLGGNYTDNLFSVINTPDGGFLLGGYSSSDISGDKSETNKGRRGTTDYWIVKIDAKGNKTWDKTIGGDYFDYLSTILNTPEGGYLLGGTSQSEISGDKTARHKGSHDFWVVNLKDTTSSNLFGEIYLIDANTDQTIRLIRPGDVINLDEIATNFLTFEYRPKSGQPVGSIQFQLEGDASLERVESHPPYVLFGENTISDFRGRNFSAGQYTLSATAYSEDLAQGQATTTLEIPFTVIGEAPAPIKQFVLVNADTEQDIQVIQEGDKIDIDQIGTNNLSIRAELQGNRAGSILLELKGKSLSHTKVENLAPYALFGGEPSSNYYGRSFCPGNYTIEATPYLGSNQTKTPGNTTSLSFQLIGSTLKVESLTLVNPGTNKDISDFTNQMTLLVSEPISIRANVGECVESVRFIVRNDMQNIVLDQVENIAPYALLGDENLVDYNPWVIPRKGTYTLEVIAFSENNGKGLKNGTGRIPFEAIDTAPCEGSLCDSLQILGLTMYDRGSFEKIGPITEGQVINIDSLPDGIVVRVETNDFTKSVSGELLVEYGNNTGRLFWRTFPESGQGLAPFIKGLVADYTMTFTPYSGTKSTGFFGESRTFNFSVIGTGPLSKPSKDVVTIAPNPSSVSKNIVHISLNKEENAGLEGRLDIFDKQGRRWHTQQVTGSEIDLDVSGLPQGYYLISIQTSSGVYKKALFRN